MRAFVAHASCVAYQKKKRAGFVNLYVRHIPRETFEALRARYVRSLESKGLSGAEVIRLAIRDAMFCHKEHRGVELIRPRGRGR